MITFKLKFLLAFSPKTKEKAKKKEAKAKPVSRKKSLIESQDPPYLIRLEKNFSAAHIDYELIPVKCKYQIDVLCWLKAAKIYTPDGVKIFKTINKNGLIFVPVCVEHTLKEISIDELVLLQSSIIEFNVYTDKNKLGMSAKNNKTEMVYLKETDCDREDFVEAHVERYNVSFLSGKKSVKTYKTGDLDDNVSRRTVGQKTELAHSQMVFEENFADKLYEIINFVMDENAPADLIRFNPFIKPYNPEEEKGKKSNLKKTTSIKNLKKEGKKGKGEKTPTKLTMQIQGEIFFTNPNLAIFKMENNKFEVSKFFVITEVDDLMTRSQKIFLNPLIIRMIQLNNFPAKIFENTCFTDLYCKYSIPCIAECKTKEKPISNLIIFNESHLYFTHTLSKIKLLEFLESKRLIVEIYGVKNRPPNEFDPKLFGEKKSDTNISKIHTKLRTTCLKREEYLRAQDELLAYCSYDLSSLLKNVWDFREKAQLHNVEHSNFKRHSVDTKDGFYDLAANCDFWTSHHLSTNSVNLGQIDDNFKYKSTTFLKEWILLENATNLDLEAFLLSPQAPALVLHQIPNTYKRLFFVAFERMIATDTFALIIQHNQKILCQNLSADNLLTGWAMDNGNNIAIFVEGLAIGYILNIWKVLENYDSELVKSFFNTDQAFEKRLYPICSKWSGFYIVTLKIPLECILQDQRVYIKGNAPIVCLKVLKKLNLLFYTRTLKQMLQYELFPTIEELTSLDLEYGVPNAWKRAEPSKTDTVSTIAESIYIPN